MAIEKIKYKNKVAIKNDESLPEINKVTDENMNEIKKVINNNADELSLIKNQIPTGQATGNPIHIADSTNLEAKLRLNGGDKQETREGSNLLNFNVEQNSKVTVNADGTLTINGTGGFSLNFEEITLKNGTTYYEKFELVSGNITGSNVFLSFNGTTWLNKSNFTNYTPSEDTKKSSLWIHQDAVFENAVVKIWANTDQSDFEQYGAMPSPDYPSKVETVGSNINLFDKDNANTINAIINGTTKQISSFDNCKTTYISCLKNTTYTISRKAGTRFIVGTTTGVPTNGVSCNQVVTNNTANAITITTTENDNYLVIFYYNGATDTLTEEEIRNSIKIEKGDKATAYSPYGMGSVEIDVVNKNWLKLENETFLITGVNVETNNNCMKLNGQTSDRGQVFDGANNRKYLGNFKKGKYTFSIKKSGDINYNNSAIAIYIRTSEKILVSTQLHTTSIIRNGTFKLTENTDIYISGYYGSAGISLTNAQILLQIELGEIASEIIEHQSQTKILPIQEEMLEGDYIEDVEHHGWNKLLATGNENWNKSTSYSSENYTMFFLNITGAKYRGQVKCNMFKYQQSFTEDGTFISSAGNSINIKVENSIIGGNTVELFKTFLQNKYNAGTPLIAYYQLSTPLDLELTEEQKEAKKINTYNNVTNIVADNSLATLDVTYKKDQNTVNKNYEDRIAALEAAILS